MNAWVPFVGLLSLPIMLVGIIGMFRPIVRLRIANRVRAAAVFGLGLTAFVIAINMPTGKISQPHNETSPIALASAEPVRSAIRRAKWNPLTDAQAIALNQNFEVMENCLSQNKGAACVDVETKEIGGGCGKYARLMGALARGELASEERTGYFEEQCTRDMREIDDPTSAISEDNATLLRNGAKSVRACLGGKEGECRAIERSAITGFCKSYGSEISSVGRGSAPNDNLRGFYKAGCERDLLEVGA